MALLVFVAVEGFVIPVLASPNLGLSVHRLGALQGELLLGLGLVWPRLKLGAGASRIAYWTYLYSSFATLTAYVLAALWGAGNTVMTLAAGTARGSAVQETIIRMVLYSAALTFLVSMAFVIRGLRMGNSREPTEQERGDR
jgi:hydroxylaminobenzene mutase